MSDTTRSEGNRKPKLAKTHSTCKCSFCIGTRSHVFRVSLNQFNFWEHGGTQDFYDSYKRSNCINRFTTQVHSAWYRRHEDCHLHIAGHTYWPAVEHGSHSTCFCRQGDCQAKESRPKQLRTFISYHVLSCHNTSQFTSLVIYTNTQIQIWTLCSICYKQTNIKHDAMWEGNTVSFWRSVLQLLAPWRGCFGHVKNPALPCGITKCHHSKLHLISFIFFNTFHKADTNAEGGMHLDEQWNVAPLRYNIYSKLQ